MEKISLIAMDMDGTLLLDGGKGIPQENVDALRAAHAAGIRLALCSGRIADDMGFYALDMGIPMHILALNGTCTLDRPLGSIIRSDYIEAAAAKGIFQLLQNYPLEYGLFGDHELIISPHGMTEKELLLVFGENIIRQGARTCIRYGSKGADALLDRGLNKFMIFAKDAAPLLDFQHQLEQNYPQVDISSSWVNNLEINPRGANKGVALTALAEKLGIPMAEVMAIGDNDNDIPMLRAAGVGVAMGNASENALAAADYATLPNHQGGVAAAIRSIALGEAIPGVRRLS